MSTVSELTTNRSQNPAPFPERVGSSPTSGHRIRDSTEALPNLPPSETTRKDQPPETLMRRAIQWATSIAYRTQKVWARRSGFSRNRDGPDLANNCAHSRRPPRAPTEQPSRHSLRNSFRGPWSSCWRLARSSWQATPILESFGLKRSPGILAPITIMSDGSLALCASSSKAHSEAVAPQYTKGVPLWFQRPPARRAPSP